MLLRLLPKERRCTSQQGMIYDIPIYILLKEQSHRSNGRRNCVEFSKGTVIWVLLNEKSCSAVNVY